MSSFKAFDIAGSGMAAQSVRLNTTASNLANADSVSGDAGERLQAAPPDFRSGARAARRRGRAARQRRPAVRVRGIYESTAPPTPRYEPGNPLADDQRLRVRAGRQRGRGDGQHDLRLALVPEQRRSHEHLQRPAAGNAAARTRLITMLDMDIINAAMVRQRTPEEAAAAGGAPMRPTPRRPSSTRKTS